MSFFCPFFPMAYDVPEAKSRDKISTVLQVAGPHIFPPKKSAHAPNMPSWPGLFFPEVYPYNCDARQRL